MPMDTFDQVIQFFQSEVFQWVVYGVLIYLGILWLALVAWVARDVVSRSRSLIFQTLMILLNMLLPIFGLFVYLLLRSPKTLTEKYYDELEHHLLLEALAEEKGTESKKKKTDSHKSKK
jgi:hypothetical protein